MMMMIITIIIMIKIRIIQMTTLLGSACILITIIIIKNGCCLLSITALHCNCLLILINQIAPYLSRSPLEQMINYTLTVHTPVIVFQCALHPC